MNTKIFSIFLILLLLLPITSCKTTVAKVEEETISDTETTEAVKDTTSTSPKETTSAEIIELNKNEETNLKDLEFNENMIKTQLRFGDRHSSKPWVQKGARVPLWYIDDWGNSSDQFIASCIVAGEIITIIGETGNEELAFPVAFQHKASKEFYIVYISFGDDKFMNYFQDNYKNQWGWPTVFFKNYEFLPSEYKMQSEKFDTLKEYLHVGDQIVLGFLNSIGLPDEEFLKDNPEFKISIDFFNAYIGNNQILYNTLVENKEIPDLIFTPWYFFINKEDQIDISTTQELTVASTDTEGLKIKIPESGNYKFSIVGGSYTDNAKDNSYGMLTLLSLFLNRPVEFKEMEHGQLPINEDAAIGGGNASSVIKTLNKNDYVILIVPDSFYGDNRGSLTVKIEKID